MRPALIVKSVVAVVIGMVAGLTADVVMTAVIGFCAGSALAMMPDHWFWE